MPRHMDQRRSAPADAQEARLARPAGIARLPSQGYTSRVIVYRELIDATDRNAEPVLAGGQPRAGDGALMTALRPGTCEIVTSSVTWVPQN